MYATPSSCLEPISKAQNAAYQLTVRSHLVQTVFYECARGEVDSGSSHSSIG